jgi:hypothetical protein
MAAVVKTATGCINRSDTTVQVEEENDGKLDLLSDDGMIESTASGSFSDMHTHQSRNISSEDFCHFHRRLSEIQDSSKPISVMATVAEHLRSFGATIRSFGATQQPDSDEDDESVAGERPEEHTKTPVAQSRREKAKENTKTSVAQSRRGCVGKRLRMFRCFENVFEPRP